MLREDLVGENTSLRLELELARHEIALLMARLARAEAGAEELAELRDLFHEAPIAYIHEDLNSRFIRANRTAVELLGIAPDAIDGTMGLSFIATMPATQQRLREARDALAAGREASTVLQLQRQNGDGPFGPSGAAGPRRTANRRERCSST